LGRECTFSTLATCHLAFGGAGITNEINRAELTGIYAALLGKHTQIATDSACSLNQVSRQLLHPELQRRHKYHNLIAAIVHLI